MMRNPLLFLILLSIVSFSCRRDCDQEFLRMELKPVVDYETGERVRVNEEHYYVSQFQREAIDFAVTFSYRGAGELCDYNWKAFPVIGGMRFRSRDMIVLDIDTFMPGEVLNEHFHVQSFEGYQNLNYLIESTSTVPDSGQYRIVCELEFDDGSFLSDSVIIEMN